MDGALIMFWFLILTSACLLAFGIYYRRSELKARAQRTESAAKSAVK